MLFLKETPQRDQWGKKFAREVGIRLLDGIRTASKSYPALPFWEEPQILSVASNELKYLESCQVSLHVPKTQVKACEGW